MGRLLRMSLDDDIKTEMDKIRPMRVKEIKEEMQNLRVKCNDIFEKGEFVERLAIARIKGVGGEGAPRATPEAASSTAAEPAASTNTDAVTEEKPSLEKEIKNIQQMRISEIKKELESYGLRTDDLFEKSEFIQRLAEARIQGASAKKQEEREDGSYRDVEVKRMKKDPEPSQQQPQNPFGGMGGMGGMGNMGGMGFQDILQNLGGMGGGMGGMGGMGGFGGPGGFGAAAGGGGMQDLISKVMGNPRAMAAVQKASQNPKIMAALQDVQQRGPSAFAKYQNDPEIMAVLDELRGIL
eukprot:CAMPEP_0117789600 /NCGR_PEP_ID=MMETSP0948-20121206/7731_1 /TAXON_ID=44440 /ORGANISM="Chattonella subsalsa, Strain CCMP2191" /LENGTH=295 /DNA_ID=CAMNT_0005619239 /DNA_START=171 /DNA_END=1058 /DNA_ORIENTATION=-